MVRKHNIIRPHMLLTIIICVILDSRSIFALAELYEVREHDIMCVIRVIKIFGGNLYKQSRGLKYSWEIKLIINTKIKSHDDKLINVSVSYLGQLSSPY